MTIMGPMIICSCPHCNQNLNHDSYISSNTFGAHQWTDGELTSPMISSNLGTLKKCPSCNELFDIDDAKEVGTFDWEADLLLSRGETPDLFHSALFGSYTTAEERQKLAQDKILYENSLEPVEPDENDYFKFIANNTLSSDTEREIRMLAWKSVNKDLRFWFSESGMMGLDDIINQQIDNDEIQSELYSDFFNVEFSKGQLENIEILSKRLDESKQDERISKSRNGTATWYV